MVGSFLMGSATFALIAAALWGGGDFSGGMAVKSAGGSTKSALRVLLLSHGLSFCCLLGWALWRGDAMPHGVPLLAGLLAGVVVSLSSVAFYIALSRGAMGASAAISGVLTAAIPAVVSGFTEGAPSVPRLAGFAVACAAIWMIAAPSAPEGLETEAASPPWLALGSGVGFGLYFVALRYAAPAGVVWPMVLARVGSLSTVTVTLTMLGLLGARAGVLAAESQMRKATVAWVAVTALLDTGGNLCFVAASRAGRLDVVAVLAALYPASTILLAGWVLRETLSRRQWAGMAVACVAVVMIVRG